MPRTSKEYRTTSKDVFAAFQEKHPDVEISYPEWCNIIYTFNYNFRDTALESGEKVKFPYGFGEWCVTKFKPKRYKQTPDGKEYIGLPVDWKKSREAGRRIYHMNYATDGYKYRWWWNNRKCHFPSPEIWSFRPSRVTSRLINHYIKLGYGDKYLKWK